MSLWHDEKYLRLLSSQLDRFTPKAHHTYNFRCPLCGDSERFKGKARGYAFPRGQVLLYKCHNCTIALPFAALLRKLNRRLYDDYIIDLLQNQPRTFDASSSKPLVAPVHPSISFAGVYPLSACRSPSHRLYSAFQFASERQLPSSGYDRIFATRRARSWLESLVGSKSKFVDDDEPYVVIPLRLADGTWYGAQIRPVAHKAYVTFRWSHEPLKVFGLDVWDAARPVYITEGPFDSLFLPNAIAACGSDILGALRVLTDVKIFTKDQPRILIWDNEPRNRDIRHQVKMAIEQHETVVLWPRSFPKDINEAIQSGLAPDDVLRIIKDSQVSGLAAELALTAWR